VLCNLSAGFGADADARTQRMAAAGAIEAILAGLSAHTSSAEVQERGFVALCNLASGRDETVDDLKIRMVEVGVIEAIERGLLAHPGCAEVQEGGLDTLKILGRHVNLAAQLVRWQLVGGRDVDAVDA